MKKTWQRQAGEALTHLGERLGIDTIVYRTGVMREYDIFGERDAPGFTRRLVTVLGEQRYLDVGAATGRYTEALRAAGVNADGCERSPAGRKLAAERQIDLVPFDLATDPVTGPRVGDYDIAFCLEVAEHIPASLGDRLVTYLAAAPTVVFTAATPGQGGVGHINERPHSYWETRFAEHGHMRIPALEAAFHSADGVVWGGYLLDNLMIYQRTG